MWKRNLFALGGLGIVWLNTAITISVFSNVFGGGLIFAVIPPILAAVAATAVVISERYKLVPRDHETTNHNPNPARTSMDMRERRAVERAMEAELVERTARLQDTPSQTTGKPPTPEKRKRTSGGGQ